MSSQTLSLRLTSPLLAFPPPGEGPLLFNAQAWLQYDAPDLLLCGAWLQVAGALGFCFTLAYSSANNPFFYFVQTLQWAPLCPAQFERWC